MHIICFIFFGLFLGIWQTQASLESLATNSPFVPVDYKPPAPPRANPPPAPKNNSKLELRGAIELDGQWQFSFYDVQKKKSYWVMQGDPKAPVHILNFSINPTSVTIEGVNGPQTIELKKPSLGGALPIAKGPVTTLSPSTGARPGKGGAPRKPSAESLELLEELRMIEELFMNAPPKAKN